MDLRDASASKNKKVLNWTKNQGRLVPGRLVAMLEVEEEAQVQEVLDRTREVRSIWGP